MQVVSATNEKVIYQELLYVLQHTDVSKHWEVIFSMLGRIYTTRVLCSFKHAEEELLKRDKYHLLSLCGQQNPCKYGWRSLG